MLRINAPALAVGILVVEPKAATTTFLFFLCHTLFYLNLITNIFFFNQLSGHIPLLWFIYRYLVDFLLDIRLVIFRITEEKMNVSERL